tara:strand:+ start:235 stop:549 length:315 start_codon:yes stop_codon:yes gene_type:complete
MERSPVDVASACEASGMAFDEDRFIKFLNEEKGVLGEGAAVVGVCSFGLNSTGRAMAEQIRMSRAPKSIVDRLKSETSQRLVNVLNFGVAAVALIVATIALWKN